MASQNIENRNHQFLGEVCNLISNYEGDLPNLRDFFRPEAIDWILKESVDRLDTSIIDFVIHTGYKDEPKVDKDGKPLLHRTTPIHLVPDDEEILIVSKLFQIFDRFDVNYIDEYGQTHFHLACRFGCEDEVLKFLEVGQDLNRITDGEGNTPLHWALKHDRNNVTKLLLRNGADPNLANDDGQTPLHVICDNCCDYSIEMAKMLLEVSDERYQPVQIDARDSGGNTPLHLAIDYHGYKNLVELLLKNGADPNATNKKGSTPLHIVCMDGSETFDTLEIFFKTNQELDQLVQVDARDNSGRTPLQCAVARLLPDVIDLLLDQGADLTSFVFPTASHFREHFHPQCKSFKLKIASGLLAVVERLENRGYELSRSNALMIMQLFDEYELFLNTNSVFAKCRYNNKQEREAKKTMINPSLSLYDLSQLRPEETAKLPTCSDFFKFARVDAHWNPHNTPGEACVKHLCEKLSRIFFRRYALDSFLELTRYQLPILCCEMILDDSLINKNLYHICLAAAGQNT
ncbi:tankyrase-1-like [Trichogramma pretiosum]|uniref:tankyrase-1-like n=1 Tax=Trichogramma pretiosum TaxID=7493 RepID=UPI000C71B883|nr:tankyrase-1-like [Trichogramma pretiosum]